MRLGATCVILKLLIVATLVVGVTGCSTPEVLPFNAYLLELSEPIPVADASLYQRPLTAGNIRSLFGVGVLQPVTGAEMKTFLQEKVGINGFDAGLASVPFLNWNSPGFIPDPQLGTELVEEGLTRFKVMDGLTAQEYLTYLRVVHGAGRCPDAQAGSADCPAQVRDLQLHLIVLQNILWNIRTGATDDNSAGTKNHFQNKFTITRENLANRLTFDFAGKALGQGGDPLRAVTLDDRCDLLVEIFATGDSFLSYLVNRVGVDPDVAAVMRNQYVGVVDPEGYQYGLDAFLQGAVCSRFPMDLGKCYEADSEIYGRLQERHPGLVFGDDLDCQQIKDMINVTTSYPPTFTLPTPLPPFDHLSPEVTGDELVDFIIAMGNALTNMPDAPFADILPQADLDLLQGSSIYNPENELTSRTINHFYDLLLGS